MAASAESMLSSLAGPAEGSEGELSGGDGGGVPEATNTAVATDPGTAGQPSSAGAPANGTAEPAPAATAGNVPAQAVKDSPEDIQRKLGAALHETRGENKSLRQELQQLRAQVEALTKPQQTDPAEPPDFLADPKGYVDTKLEAALAKLDKAEKTTQETAEQVKQREANEAIWRATQNHEAQFYAQTPDYPDALQHIRSVRTQQLQQLFPDATPEQIASHISYEERETARQLVSQNRNPAEFAYNFAQTLGYKKAAPPAPAKPAAAPIDKDAVRTLGSGGGSGAPTEDAGNSMPEFAAALSERFKRKK